MASRRMALFGGTFDPIHLGHTTVAMEAADQLAVERIVLIPAKRSPLKQTLPCASDDDRVAMLRLAIQDDPLFDLSTCELHRPAPSFTLDTLRQLKDQYGKETTMYWLLGADGLKELPRWYRIAEILDECTISTMYRPGCSKPDFSGFESLWGKESVDRLQKHVVQTSLIPISSTEIRHRLATGEDLSKMLHPAVLDYIVSHHLYR